MRQPRTCCHHFVLLLWLCLSLAWPGYAQAQPAAPTFPATATVLQTANLRASPSTTAARTGSAAAGSSLTLTGCNTACDWYRTAEGAWIAAFLVEVKPAQAGTLALPTATPTVQGTPAAVTRIVDGDTIEVTIAGTTHRLRYILINTPETGQPYADAATAANRDLVMGKTVYLVKDVSETDRYDRLLRYVYLADGTFVNAELVRQGFAQVATYPPDVSQEPAIRAAEAEARAAGRGLWATGAESFGPAGAATTGAANLRSGPGTGYPIVRTAPAGTALALTGKDASGEWLQTDDGLWVFAALVEGAPTNLRVVGTGSAPAAAPQRSGGGVTVPVVAPTPAPPAAPASTGAGQLRIVAVNKRDEYVDLRNDSGAPINLAGWVLRSEKGSQDCALGGEIGAGATLRVWAMSGAGGFSCGFGSNIWNNSERDLAVLLAPGGAEVGRWD